VGVRNMDLRSWAWRVVANKREMSGRSMAVG
jgi:hypothetical protein